MVKLSATRGEGVAAAREIAKESERPVNPLFRGTGGGGPRWVAMPRYYFHLTSRGDRLRDEEGLPLPDGEAAWYQAVRSARELLRADLHLGCSWEDQAVEIEDERGRQVDRLPLADIVRYTIGGG
jgi:hypothetical protein